ncbi:MAG TPA: hypothetical protein VG710_06770 [Opitutus sp.]|nr:hypothetical protein [Opitutus sp.]
MKLHHSPSSSRQSPSDPLDRRLAAYAAAGKAFVAVGAVIGGAARAGAQILPITQIVLGNPPEQVTYTGPSVVTGDVKFHPQDVEPGWLSRSGFRFNAAHAGAWSNNQSGGRAILGFPHYGGPALQFQFVFEGTVRRPIDDFSAYDNVAKLHRGNSIAGRDFAAINDRFLLAYREGGGTLVGDFAGHANQSGYLGFKLSNGGQLYYGWMRVRVMNNADGSPASLVFVADANQTYGALALAGSVNGGNIVAGQTTLSEIPEPASMATGLALFALGAAGVREHRKRRRAAA